MISESRGFSCPHVGLNSAFFDMIVVEHARQTIGLFLARHGAALDQAGRGLRALLESWLSSEISFDAVWDLAFGELRVALPDPSSVPAARCAAAVGLRLHEFGLPGHWEIEFPEPAYFRFGRWLLPPCEALRVAAGAERVELHLRSDGDWRPVTFRSCEGGWTSEEAAGFTELLRSGGRITVLTSKQIFPLGSVAFETDIYKVVPDTDAALLVRTCDGAAALVKQHAPIYDGWIARVLRDLIPLKLTPGMFNSGSNDRLPGVSCVSNQHSPLMLAEMLIDEASHQHLHVLSLLGPLEDGTDPTLYYSPIRDAARPIHFILLAYHAFGNVLLFFRAARSIPDLSSEEREVVHGKVERLEHQLGVLSGALEKTTALTDYGRALWEPLRERVRA